MSDWLDETRNRHDVVTVPIIWVAILLSLLVHVAVMWWWLPNMRLPMFDKSDQGQSSLQVRLTPPPSPPPAPAVRAQPAPAPQAKPAPKVPVQPTPSPKAPPPKAVARAQPAPPVIALNRPTPAAPPPIQTPPSAPAPTRSLPPAEGDLASYIEARRRARADVAPPPSPGSKAEAPPAEDDNARSKRIVAENLATHNTPTFGDDPTKSGGIFQIKRMSYEDAEFVFFGWNKDIRRNTRQLIEVQRGNNSDIRIAVVRRIIAIIREYEQEDFLWESKRLGRNITLSARAKDNAGLESFLMREFFGDARMTP